MADFLATDAGLMAGLVAFAVGLSDLLIGWFWLYRRKGLNDTSIATRLKFAIPYLISFDLVLLAVGCYTVYIHFIATPHIAF